MSDQIGSIPTLPRETGTAPAQDDRPQPAGATISIFRGHGEDIGNYVDAIELTDAEWGLVQSGLDAQRPEFGAWLLDLMNRELTRLAAMPAVNRN